jgi:predicted lysophospholipase L1 biosynthesis ABC-type transport system permease subunit
VRVALGADRGRVVGLVLGQTVLDVGIGLAIGLALSRLMERLLYGVTPTDPVAFALVVPALLAIALVAAFARVRRALAIAPSEALRHE